MCLEAYRTVSGPVHITPEKCQTLLIYRVKLTVHSKPDRKPEEFEKRRLCVLVWTKNILKTDVFEITMTSRDSHD